MPYDKETRDALQAYYETHDFTGNIPAFDDKKYTPAQLQIYVKAKKFFAQSVPDGDFCKDFLAER